MDSAAAAWLFVIVVVFAAIALSKRLGGSAGARDEMLCTRCHAQGKPETGIKGSLVIEIVLWLLMIVPGLLYTLWRSSSKFPVCAACGSPDMIPLDSPRAKEIITS